MKLLQLVLFIIYVTSIWSSTSLATKKTKKKVKKHGKHRKSTTQRKPLVYCLPRELNPDNPDHYCNVIISKFVSSGQEVPVGTTCLSPVHLLHPTQYSIGRTLQMCKKNIVESKFTKKADFIKYILYNPAPGVVGRSWGLDWSIYITDHHHMAAAISIAHDNIKNFAKYRLLRICVTADFTGLGEAEFEDTMLRKGWLWPYDRFGQRIAISRIPPTISTLQDDPFRSLSEYVRDGHGYIKCGIAQTGRFTECRNRTDNLPFFEFIWGDFLRQQLVANDSSVASLYNLSWQEQIPVFNEIMFDAIKLTTSRLAVQRYMRVLPGLNLNRKYLHHVKVNKTDGCDKMYNDLILREEYGSMEEPPSTGNSTTILPVPWYNGSAHEILYGAGVFFGILFALFVMNYCLRPSLATESLVTDKLKTKEVKTYNT